MCGFVGILRFENESGVDLSNLLNMTKTIKHRGPDDEGFVVEQGNGKVKVYFGDDTPESVKDSFPELARIEDDFDEKSTIALGHRRLSIIDVTPAGHQPMSYADGRYWIAYNGEVYNYIELRKELELHGYHFKTQTDTEVILAAYDQWGVACQNKFNGMWAFIIYDVDKQTIFLSRDRFGIKPLYFYQNDNLLIVASEIKAILEYDNVVARPNIEYLQEYLEKGAMEYKAETAFKDIYRFPFASYTVLDLSQKLSTINAVRYWDYEINLSNEQFDINKSEKYADKYLDLLMDSVRLRMRSDVKIGVSLSGGIDSSSVIYLVSKIMNQSGMKNDCEAFSNVHAEQKKSKYDESEYMYEMCKLLNIKPNVIVSKCEDIPKIHLLSLLAFESPAEGFGLGGRAVCELMDDYNVKVSLDGQGADEQQAGYGPYFVNYFSNISYNHIFKEYYKASKTSLEKKYINIGVALKILKTIFGYNILIKAGRMLGKDLSIHLLPLNERLKLSTATTLVNLLHYADSRSMSYSQESRMPFMDYRLVEYMASIPACYKIHSGWTKYFARTSFHNKLPDKINWRVDKMGWPIPYQEYLGGDLKSWYREQMDENYTSKELGIALDEQKSINRNMRIINIKRWYAAFMGNDKGN